MHRLASYARAICAVGLSLAHCRRDHFGDLLNGGKMDAEHGPVAFEGTAQFAQFIVEAGDAAGIRVQCQGPAQVEQRPALLVDELAKIAKIVLLELLCFPLEDICQAPDESEDRR